MTLTEKQRVQLEDRKREFDEWVRREREHLSKGNRPSWTDPGDLHSYLCEVLELDVACAREQAASEDVEIRSPDVLVVMVGTTPQACAVTIHLQEPRRVVLVHTDGSGESAGQIKEWLRESPIKVELANLSDRRDDLSDGSADSDDESDPVYVYRFVLDVIRRLDPPPSAEAGYVPLVVDITGGRKTMVAAAFMLASELDARATYIEGEYSGLVGLPKPGTLRLRRLEDPAAILALRERRAIGEHLDALSWDKALLLVERVQAGLQHSRVASDSSKADLDRLRAALRVCITWEAGRYRDAIKEFQRVGRKKAPLPVRRLGSAWSGGSGKLRSQMRDHAAFGLLYVVDGLRHVRRRLERPGAELDLGAAYLRLFALGEVAMDVLLGALSSRGAIRAYDPSDKPICPPQRKSLLKTLEGAVPASLLLLAGELVSSDRSDRRVNPAEWLRQAAPDFRPAPGMNESEGWSLQFDLSAVRLHHEDGFDDDEEEPCLCCGLDRKNGRPARICIEVEEQQWAPLAEVAPWLSQSWRSIRNDCAHGFPRASQEQVNALADHLAELVRAVGVRIGSSSFPDGARVDLSTEIERWLTAKEFEPPLEEMQRLCSRGVGWQ